MVWAHVMFNLQTMPNMESCSIQLQFALFQQLPRKEIRFVSVSQDGAPRFRKTWAVGGIQEVYRLEILLQIPLKSLPIAPHFFLPPKKSKNKSGSVLFRSTGSVELQFDACLIPLTQNQRKPTITLGRTPIAQR